MAYCAASATASSPFEASFAVERLRDALWQVSWPASPSHTCCHALSCRSGWLRHTRAFASVPVEGSPLAAARSCFVGSQAGAILQRRLGDPRLPASRGGLCRTSAISNPLLRRLVWLSGAVSWQIQVPGRERFKRSVERTCLALQDGFVEDPGAWRPYHADLTAANRRAALFASCSISSGLLWPLTEAVWMISEGVSEHKYVIGMRRPCLNGWGGCRKAKL